MKEDMLDVLMYLFDHCMGQENKSTVDEGVLFSELEAAGFETGEINRAFDWLERLRGLEHEKTEFGAISDRNFRILTPYEMKKVGVKAWGFLQFLENSHVITPAQRELILNRAMELKIQHIDLDRFKWVILVVLYNINDENDHDDWLEELVLSDINDIMH
jgi:Smg protein